MRTKTGKIKTALLLTLTMSVVLPATCSIVQAGEFAAELPPGAQVKQEPIFWGEEVNGLQLGISLSPKLDQRVDVSIVNGQPTETTSYSLRRFYRIGEEAAFAFSVRNVSEHPIKITYSRPWSVSPRVVDEEGKQLSIYQQALLFGPAYNGFFVSPSSTSIVTPGEILHLAHAYAHLTIGPPKNIKILDNPTLDVPPGKYQVSYNFGFVQDPKEEKTASLKSWVGSLAAKIILEVAPPKNQ